MHCKVDSIFSLFVVTSETFILEVELKLNDPYQRRLLLTILKHKTIVNKSINPITYLRVIILVRD